MNIDIYRSTTHGNLYILVPEDTDVDDLKLESEDKEKYSDAIFSKDVTILRNSTKMTKNVSVENAVPEIESKGYSFVIGPLVTTG